LSLFSTAQEDTLICLSISHLRVCTSVLLGGIRKICHPERSRGNLVFPNQGYPERSIAIGFFNHKAV
jgi:hypothetical protein